MSHEKRENGSFLTQKKKCLNIGVGKQLKRFLKALVALELEEETVSAP